LKQNQYSPLTVAEQVISVFTGVRGYLDDVELTEIKRFESEILEKIKNEKNEIISTIQTTGKLEKEVEDSLVQAIQEYKKSKK
jgi:F-type H+-transporting ATPase subunit alpha